MPGISDAGVDPSVLALLDTCFEDALASLLEVYGNVQMSITRTAASTVSEPRIAVLGYGCPTLRGSLSLLMSDDTVRGLRPEKLDDIEVFDWAGELANQLGGRFKNQLLRRGGPVIEVGTPAVITGMHVQLRPFAGAPAVWRLAAGPIAIEAVLQRVPRADLTIRPRDDDEEDPPEEGSLLLF